MTNGPYLSDFMYILVISKYSSYMICKSVIHNTVVYLTFVCMVVSILRYQSWYHTEVKKLQLQYVGRLLSGDEKRLCCISVLCLSL